MTQLYGYTKNNAEIVKTNMDDKIIFVGYVGLSQPANSPRVLNHQSVWWIIQHNL